MRGRKRDASRSAGIAEYGCVAEREMHLEVRELQGIDASKKGRFIQKMPQSEIWMKKRVTFLILCGDFCEFSQNKAAIFEEKWNLDEKYKK